MSSKIENKKETNLFQRILRKNNQSTNARF